jgi:hypothetical protein
MPVAVNFGDDVAIHEDAEHWEYSRVGSDGPWIISLVDGGYNPVGTELVFDNVSQITTLTEEEYEESVEMMRR